MAMWMRFEQADGAPILIDMESVDAVSIDGPATVRVWFGCPKDDPTPSQDIYGSVLVKGEFDRLALLLDAGTFP